MATNDCGPDKPTDRGTADPQQINAQPQWEYEWSNVKRRNEKDTDKINDRRLRKRKVGHIAHERDVSRQRASHLLKYGDAEVPDEVVL